MTEHVQLPIASFVDDPYQPCLSLSMSATSSLLVSGDMFLGGRNGVYVLWLDDLALPELWDSSGLMEPLCSRPDQWLPSLLIRLNLGP